MLNMQIEYIAFEEELTSESGDSYIAYGIEVREDGRTIRRVPDVTSDEHDARDFASLCTRLKLDPMQLDDAIYDLLCTA